MSLFILPPCSKTGINEINIKQKWYEKDVNLYEYTAEVVKRIVVWM